MATWKEVADDVDKNYCGDANAALRKYLEEYAEHASRNVVVYYSCWLQKPQLTQKFPEGFIIADGDKISFMDCFSKLESSRGLDLVLHTPGGDIAATESLVAYVRATFGTNVRAVVPQLAMSCGTMIACACKEILMGKQSSLGPTDPQIHGVPAQAILDEFERAVEDIKKDPVRRHAWQPILSNYGPTWVEEADNASKWAVDLVREWLQTGMFKRKRNASERTERVLARFGSHSKTKSHSRHISRTDAKACGLSVTRLEADEELEDIVVNLHNLCVLSAMRNPSLTKMMANHLGACHHTVVAR